MNADNIRKELEIAAATATQEFLDRNFGGKDGGICGFAWVTIFPKHKGNTRQGREERLLFEELGATRDFSGRNYQIWNPSKNACQSVDAKLVGAIAAANVLRKYGLAAYSSNRID